MAVVIRLQGLPIVAGTMDIRHFFSGLTIPDGGVHIVGGELDGRVPVPGGAVRGLPEPPRRGPELQVDPLCVLLQDAGDGRWAELDHTEKVKNCQDPEFCKKLVVDCYFKKVVSSSVFTRLLELKQEKSAGKGTIMVIKISLNPRWRKFNCSLANFLWWRF